MAFLLLLVVAELGVAVLASVFREEFLEGLEGRLGDQLATKYGIDIENHYQSNNIAHKDFTTSVDFTQYRVSRCTPRLATPSPRPRPRAPFLFALSLANAIFPGVASHFPFPTTTLPPYC